MQNTKIYRLNKFCLRIERQVRDMRYKATRQIVEFCQTHDVDTVFSGNPDGVRVGVLFRSSPAF